MKIRSLYLALNLFFVSVPFTQAQSVDHWETIVYDSTMWHYFVGTSNPGTDWKNADFDDTSWAQGKGGIGYGDGDDRTSVSTTMSVFLRKTFAVNDLDKIDGALLHVDYDDGYVAYLNGTEIARRNIGTINPVPYDWPASSAIEPVLPFGGTPEGVFISSQTLEGLLVAGDNVLAIEVHNANTTSSDISSTAFLSVGITDQGSYYDEVPDWFEAPLVFTSSMLPIIIINSDETIQDDPRIVANMGIIDNGEGNANHVDDPFTDYDGKIGIEIRGESSQMFPKKSYTVETIDESGNNRNAALLGMPPENDWVLYAPYSDKTLMRNVITYEWGRKLGMYASRVRYVELVINGDYKGVYVLLEKIKRDKNRVDIASLKTTDISGDDLTGGYLLRVDKVDGNDYPAWTSTPVPKLPGENTVNFQFFDPKGEELLAVQQNYIKNFIFGFESALSSDHFKDASTGYRKYIDVSSFVDFMIVTELGKNIDGYVFSTYMYKDKDSNDNRLHMGPLWDFNLAYGNVDYLANSQYAPGWTYNDSYRMYWFRRLMQDTYFTNKMKCRWTALRNSVLSNGSIMNMIDSIAGVLAEPQQRNYKRWPILDTYVWPNQYYDTDGTYQAEIDFLKQWIASRLTWMDNNMPGSGSCSLVTAVDREGEKQMIVYPNPSNKNFYFQFPDQSHRYSVAIYSSQGQCVYRKKNITGGELTWNADDNNIPAGLYFAVISSTNGQQYSVKLSKE